MRLQTRLAFCVVAAAFLGLITAVPVTYFVVDRVLIDIKETQLRSELNDIGNSVTNLISVGLPLSALRRTQDLIERGRNRNPQIGAILVFDASGQILYSTDLGEVGRSVPTGWRDAAAGINVRTDSELVAIAPLFNSFGSKTGGMALRYALANMASQREELWLLLVAVAAVGLGLTAALADWLTGRILRHFRGGVEAVIADMESLVASRPSSELPDTGSPWLMGRYRPFAARARSTLADLERYTRDLARMDETG